MEEKYLKALRACINGECDRSLSNYPDLLHSITYSGYLVDVKVPANKPSVIACCEAILNSLDNSAA